MYKGDSRSHISFFNLPHVTLPLPAPDSMRCCTVTRLSTRVTVPLRCCSASMRAGIALSSPPFFSFLRECRSSHSSLECSAALVAISHVFWRLPAVTFLMSWLPRCRDLCYYVGNIASDISGISTKVSYENMWRSHFCSIIHSFCHRRPAGQHGRPQKNVFITGKQVRFT